MCLRHFLWVMVKHHHPPWCPSLENMLDELWFQLVPECYTVMKKVKPSDMEE